MKIGQYKDPYKTNEYHERFERSNHPTDPICWFIGSPFFGEPTIIVISDQTSNHGTLTQPVAKL